MAQWREATNDDSTSVFTWVMIIGFVWVLFNLAKGGEPAGRICDRIGQSVYSQDR